MTEQEMLKLFEDKEFVEELVKQKTTEDAQKFLFSKGIDLTIEEIEMLGKCIAEYEKHGELTDEVLEQIIGGLVSFPEKVKNASITTGVAISFIVRVVTTTIGAIAGGFLRGFSDGWVAAFYDKGN